MPHFSNANVLNRDEERACTEGQMIRMIQRVPSFPPSCAKRASAAWCLQFNVNEFGAIRDETVLKSAHPKLDKAALDAHIPRLEPGTQQEGPFGDLHDSRAVHHPLRDEPTANSVGFKRLKHYFARPLTHCIRVFYAQNSRWLCLAILWSKSGRIVWRGIGSCQNHALQRR